MGWLVPQAVRDFSKARGTAKAVLWTIASYCNDAGNMDGAKYPPSYETIAKGAGCSVSGVKSSVKKLMELGELSMRKEGKGRAVRVFFTVSPRLIEQERDKTGCSLREDWYTQSTNHGEMVHTEYQSMVQEVNQLKEMVHTLSGMVQNQGVNGTHRVPISNNKEINNKEEEKRGEERAHAQGEPNYNDDGFWGSEESPQEKFQREHLERVKAISDVTGSLNKAKVEEIAVKLGDAGILAQKIYEIYGCPEHRERYGKDGYGWWYLHSFGREAYEPPKPGNLLHIKSAMTSQSAIENGVPAQSTKPMPAQVNINRVEQTPRLIIR